MFNKTNGLAIALTLMTFLPEIAQARDVYSDKGKQAAWIEVSKDTVRNSLRDSRSAKFKDVFFNKAFMDGKPLPIVCGKVNAKNGFGGYSGFQRFVASGSRLSFLEDQVSSSREFTKIWNMLCR